MCRLITIVQISLTFLDQPPLGPKGYVTADLARQYLPPAGLKDKVKIFVCGPPPQVAAIAGKKAGSKQGEVGGVLKELGYTEDQVSISRFEGLRPEIDMTCSFPRFTSFDLECRVLIDACLVSEPLAANNFKSGEYLRLQFSSNPARAKFGRCGFCLKRVIFM